jgi:hypothetical protein
VVLDRDVVDVVGALSGELLLDFGGGVAVEIAADADVDFLFGSVASEFFSSCCGGSFRLVWGFECWLAVFGRC